LQRPLILNQNPGSGRLERALGKFAGERNILRRFVFYFLFRFPARRPECAVNNYSWGVRVDEKERNEEKKSGKKNMNL